MKHVKLMATLALLSLALMVVVYPLYAHCGKCAADGKKIASQLDQNKMTLARAVTAAEQHSKGRAIAVTSDVDEKDALALNVYCIVSGPSQSAAAKIMKCTLDPASANVRTMKEVQEFPISKHEHADQSGAAKPMDATPKGSAMNITNRTVDAACGVCVYKMSGQVGCPLAVKIDGKPYIVQGANWPNHDYCDRDCKAIVSGRIEGDKFIATSLKVKD